MKRQRRTLGLVLVWLVAALVAIGPRGTLHLRRGNDNSTDVRRATDLGKHSSRTITGDLTALAADLRHSRGAELAKLINLQNDGLHPGEAAAANQAPLGNDRRHSTGIELAQRINWENDGLSQCRLEAQRRIAEKHRRPRLIGWTISGYDVATIAWQRLAPNSVETSAGTHSRPTQDCSHLASSGWSGCTAYSSLNDEFAPPPIPSTVPRRGAVRLLETARLVVDGLQLTFKVLSPVADWLPQDGHWRTASMLNRRDEDAATSRTSWRSARSTSFGNIGL